MGFFDVKNGNDLKRLIFYLEDHERLFMGLFELTIRDKKQMQIFDQSHGLTLPKNQNFATFLFKNYYCLKRLLFYLAHHEGLFRAILI